MVGIIAVRAQLIVISIGHVPGQQPALISIVSVSLIDWKGGYNADIVLFI